MKWIINHKKYRISDFIGSLIVAAVEIVMLSICSIFVFSILKMQGEEWYQEATVLESESDLLFTEKMHDIFLVLWITIVFIYIFCIIAMCMFRRMQLEDMVQILGVYIVTGYWESKVGKMLLFDAVMDFLLSVPFAFFFMNRAAIFLSKEQVFYVIISNVASPRLFLLFNVLNAAALLIIVHRYDLKWLKGKTSTGLAEMIKVRI